MPVTSVKALRKALKGAGLRVVPGGSHLRIETADGTLISSMPLAKATPQALLNCRSYLAKRCEAIRERRDNGGA
jgi:hypothetical protein